MAAPKSAPAGSRSSRFYSSPQAIPESWSPDQPGIVEGFQPRGPLLGAPGPDQGFALTVAHRLADEIQLSPGERRDDAIRGSVGIALRRASLYSRAPTVHDVRLAFTIWGYFLTDPPTDLVARRLALFEGVGNVLHHYAEGRRIADLVPESTLHLTPEEAVAAMPGKWRELTGA
ncbi:MAG: hypothetical protein CSA55_01255 [Ilumatobacter coccineus]|uniref:Uncharacterized protein n=1 Tax=Ilumatobacter coccineus TaxID=467094 RepID=A0A2G6KF36_9ACTN|nr:MAG: hypothetical protein CSA55_01255 [Ilumatobacter coccineus]